MLSFKIKFIFADGKKGNIEFESNEKPFKGEAYHIEDNGSSEEFKVLDVQKVVVSKGDGSGLLEYYCKIEKSDIRSIPIGFK